MRRINVRLKNLRNFNTFWTSDQKNIRNLNTFRAPDRCAIEKPKEFQYLLIIRSKNIRNLNTLCVVLNIEFYYKTEQIGTRCSGTQKCSQRFEIDHFCPGNISAIQSLKFFVNPIRESFVSQLNVRYTYETELKLEKWNRRLVWHCSWLEFRYKFRNLWFQHRGQ